MFDSFQILLATVIACGAPPSVSVFSYNTRVATKFAYKAQLVPVSDAVLDLESRWRCNVLKCPWNSLPAALIYHGAPIGFYQLDFIAARAASAAVRAAAVTVADWPAGV